MCILSSHRPLMTDLPTHSSLTTPPTDSVVDTPASSIMSQPPIRDPSAATDENSAITQTVKRHHDELMNKEECPPSNKRPRLVEQEGR